MINDKKYLYLENTSDGHNKFYEMKKVADKRFFKASWGMIGSQGRSKVYNIVDWENKYREKINKDYVVCSDPEGRLEFLNRIDKLMKLLHTDGIREDILSIDSIRARYVETGNLTGDDMVEMNKVYKMYGEIKK